MTWYCRGYRCSVTFGNGEDTMQINLKMTAIARLANDEDPDYEILNTLKEIVKEVKDSERELIGRKPSDMQELGNYFGLSDQRIEEMKEYVTGLK